MGLLRLRGHMHHNWPPRIVQLEELVRTSKNSNPIILMEYLRLHNLFHPVPYPLVEKYVAEFVSRIADAGGSVVAWFTTSSITDQEAISEKRHVEKEGHDYEKLMEERPEIFRSFPYYLFADRHVVNDAFDSAGVKLLNGSRHKMIKFANENNCVAIIAQDSDFMIFDMIPKYLLIKSLNIITLEVEEHSRREVMACFRLTSNEQLRTFASLIGGTTVKITKLEEFHTMLKDRYRKSVLPAVAKFVKEESPERIRTVLNRFLDAETLAKIEEAKEYYALKEIFTDTIEESPLPFKIEWRNLVILYFLEHCNGPDIRIFTDFSDQGIQDPIPAIRVRLLPLRKKMYSLIFKKRRRIKEIYSYGEGGESNEIRFQSLNIPADVDLDKIRSEDRSPDLQDLRWRLFVDAVCPSAWFGDFRNLPPHLVIPMSTLIYLQDTGSLDGQALRPEELRYLLATILYVAEESTTIQSSLILSLRSLHVITMFLNVCSHVCMLNTLCGWIIPPSEASVSKWFCKKVAMVMSQKSGLVDKVLEEISNAELSLDLLRKYSTLDCFGE